MQAGGDISVCEGEGGESVVYRLAAGTGFAFGNGETFSQTRWGFA